MRVVHVCKVKGIAGAEGHLLRLLPGLARHGVAPHMLVLEDGRSPATSFCQALREREVPVETVPIAGHVDPGLPGRLVRRLGALRPALVHTHLAHADLYALPAAARAGVPRAVSTRHNDDAFRSNWLMKRLTRHAMRHARRVITASHAVARFVREVEGLDAARVVTIHYGLEPPALDPGARVAARAALGQPPDGPLVGVVGRSVRQKGIDVLLEAFPSVALKHPGARLVVIGDGPQRPALVARARRLGLGDLVTFTGWVEDAIRLMPACDVIVVPSRWEGFGLAALEAMGCARPVVASWVGALPEVVVDGQTGVLVPPEDAVALASAIAGLLDDPERAAALGAAGHARLVRSFTVERMIRATLAVYGEVVSPLPGPG